ncbi:TraI domain-containing protein, partial [Pseudomonas aeruginosa]|uniref:TraI domain-containing protein n=1 Tax=Pseudomonas aeruginosa TaxID=287 RepID=UPI00259D1D5C
MHQPYRFRYRDDREYRLHSAATGLLYRQLLDSDALDWLSGYPDLWGPLLYVLAGQYEHAGVLGELVVQADRASVAQELGGDPARAMAAPSTRCNASCWTGPPCSRKNELNQPEASDGWLTEGTLAGRQGSFGRNYVRTCCRRGHRWHPLRTTLRCS